MSPNNRDNRIFGLKSCQLAIIFGILGAAFVASGNSISPFFFFFTSLPLLLSHLCCGEKEGIVSLALFSSIVLIFYGLDVFDDALCCVVAPSFVFGYFAVKNIKRNKKVWWYPESFLLRNLVIVAIVASFVLSLTICSEKAVAETYDKVIKLIADQENIAIKIAAQNFTNSLIKYTIGINVIMKMCTIAINIVAAHRIGKKMKINIRPEFDVLNLEISNVFAVLPMVFLALGLLVPTIYYVCIGMFIASLLAPIANGISLVHYFAIKTQKSRFLGFFYIFMFLFLPPAIIATVIVGMVDSFFNIRQKIDNSSQNLTI